MKTRLHWIFRYAILPGLFVGGPVVYLFGTSKRLGIHEHPVVDVHVESQLSSEVYERNVAELEKSIALQTDEIEVLQLKFSVLGQSRLKNISVDQTETLLHLKPPPGYAELYGEIESKKLALDRMRLALNTEKAEFISYDR